MNDEQTIANDQTESTDGSAQDTAPPTTDQGDGGGNAEAPSGE